MLSGLKKKKYFMTSRLQNSWNQHVNNCHSAVWIVWNHHKFWLCQPNLCIEITDKQEHLYLASKIHSVSLFQILSHQNGGHGSLLHNFTTSHFLSLQDCTEHQMFVSISYSALGYGMTLTSISLLWQTREFVEVSRRSGLCGSAKCVCMVNSIYVLLLLFDVHCSGT